METTSKEIEAGAEVGKDDAEPYANKSFRSSGHTGSHTAMS